MKPDELRAELRDERDFLLRSLDDLEAERDAGELDEADYRALTDDYTARAAGVLRRLQNIEAHVGSGDGVGQATPKTSAARISGPRVDVPADPADPGRAGKRSRWPMVLGVLATVSLAAGSGYLVSQSSGERRPDQGVSGGPETSPRSMLQDAVELDNSGKLVDAAKLYDAVLAKEPENVVALTRRGWVLGRSGRQARSTELLQAGLGYLDRATKIDPSYPDAHAFKGLVLGALSRPGDAGCEFRLWLAIAPITDPQRPAIEGVLDEATKQAGGSLPECPKPSVPVPVPG